MTYKELLEQLSQLSTEQLNQDVTIYDVAEDEYFASQKLGITKETDVLDAGHAFLIVE